MFKAFEPNFNRKIDVDLRMARAAAPPAFGGGNFDITNRPQTGASVRFVTSNTDPTVQVSPDCSPVLQQVGNSFAPTAIVVIPNARETSPGEAAGEYEAFEALGTQPAKLVVNFSQEPPPNIDDVDPHGGSPAVEKVVTITGSDFVNGATVTFGGASANSVTFVDSTKLTATTTSRAVGTVDVVVTNPDTKSGTKVDGFTYEGIRGTVKVEVLAAAINDPLVEATIELLQAGIVIDSTATDSNGIYLFPDGLESVNPGTYTIRVNFRHDDPASGRPILRVQHGNPGVPVTAETGPVTLTAGEVEIADITFDDLGTTTLTTDVTIPVDRLDDLAVIYFHSMQALRYGTDVLGVTHDLLLPIDVFSYFDVGGAFYACENCSPTGADVFIPVTRADVTHPNRPMNREWHEMFHELMDDSIGLPNLGGEPSHRGFANSSTAGSWVEGWGTFWSTQLWEYLGLPDSRLYRLAGGFVDLEANQLAFEPVSGEREEYAVAGLLFDLFDGINPLENDAIDIDPITLFASIGNTPLADMKAVYDRLTDDNIGAGDPDCDGLTNLDNIFVTHGFFVDADGNGGFDPGEIFVDANGNCVFDQGEVFIDTNGNNVFEEREEVGRAADPPRAATRSEVPPIPGTNLLISVVGELGQAVQEGTVEISVQYEPAFAFYNDTFTMSLQSDVIDGLLGLYPPPAKYIATITIRVLTPAGGISDALVIDNVAFWQAVEGTENDFVGGHDFDLAKTDETTVLTFNQAPVANAGADRTIEWEGQDVSLDGGGSNDPDGAELAFSWTLTGGPPATIADTGIAVTTFTPSDVGTYTFTLNVTDPSGEVDLDEVVFTVEDNTAPEINELFADPNILRPPNHKMIPVTISVDVFDAYDAEPTCKIIDVTSDEAVEGEGDGNTSLDWQDTGDLTLDLRSERSGQGDGRVYTITIECTDVSGNPSTQDVTVTVSHDQGKGGGKKK